MGIVSSKDESGAVVAQSLRGQDILDYEGRDLRDKMDLCLSKHMWYWTIGGVLISLPLCVLLKSQKPVFGAALICPIGDMMYATNKCYPEKEAFAAHYKMLQQKRAAAIQEVLNRDKGGAGAGDLQQMSQPSAAADVAIQDAAAVEQSSGAVELQGVGRGDGELQVEWQPEKVQGDAQQPKRKGWLW